MDLSDAVQFLGVGNVGAVSLVTLFVVLILTGRLVPRSIVDDIQKRADRQTQVWRDAYESVEQVRKLQAEQIGELMEHARTATHLIQSLPKSDDDVRP